MDIKWDKNNLKTKKNNDAKEVPCSSLVLFFVESLAN